MKRETSEVRIGTKRLTLSNLGKVFYPKAGFTKGDVIHFYREISPVLLPHLKDRPLTLKRYPNGVEGKFFYEKNCPSHRPDWVKTTEVYSEGRGEDISYCLCNDLPTLVWAANLADLELHTSLSKAKAISKPTSLVFDLDPGAPADVRQCGAVALRLRDLFEHLDLETFVKTSGSKGLQLYVPLNTATNYDQTKAFSHAVARLLEKQTPNEVTSNMRKDLRKGRIFVDWSQNDEHKTTINVYSLRAQPTPTVSTPLDWKELEKAVKKNDAAALKFEAKDVLRRVAKKGDLFERALTLKQKLPNFDLAEAEEHPESVAEP